MILVFARMIFGWVRGAGFEAEGISRLVLIMPKYVKNK